MAEIIVSIKELASFPEQAEAGHDWLVEGDFGFLASYATRSEAARHASEEAAAQSGVTWQFNE